VTRGLVLGGDDDDVIEEAKARVAKALIRTQKQGSTDPGVVHHAVREAVSQFVWERARRRPMILPIVMEV
jgi:ribonuclease J